ncbi:alpha/beta-hydrolase [Pleomassaria siparia CBS 279.74]|uniref:Alpha/beta-hydrolase n=1 Tax=Pleomassaria siparia CBS 279.74 TaxID=1314801 RepID=A0A6G1K0R3_9PLEO|nr:alpha/beta-hydrolase [Pleomassaria siparia CBS 279.74]
MKFSSAFALAGVVGSVAASPISFQAREDGFTYTDKQLTEAKFFAQYAAASYCEVNNNSTGTLVECTEDVCDLPEANKAITVAEWTATEKTGMMGFVAIDPVAEVIVLSFRGSHSVRNWIANFGFGYTKYKAAPTCSKCKVHSGFYKAYQESEPFYLPALQAAVANYPTYRLTLTGHSLGGGVATVAAGVLRSTGYSADLYTYGSPRAGNAGFANFVSAQPGITARVTHINEPVPKLPPAFLSFRHTTPEYWLSNGDATTVNYTASDVKVCNGIATKDCNFGTGASLNSDAHGFYFESITACAPKDGTPFKRDDLQASGYTDEQLEEMIAADLAYAKTLGA